MKHIIDVFSRFLLSLIFIFVSLACDTTGNDEPDQPNDKIENTGDGSDNTDKDVETIKQELKSFGEFRKVHSVVRLGRGNTPVNYLKMPGFPPIRPQREKEEYTDVTYAYINAVLEITSDYGQITSFINYNEVGERSWAKSSYSASTYGANKNDKDWHMIMRMPYYNGDEKTYKYAKLICLKHGKFSNGKTKYLDIEYFAPFDSFDEAVLQTSKASPFGGFYMVEDPIH